MAILLADAIDDTIGKLNPPSQIKSLTDKGGSAGISSVLSSIIELIVVAGVIASIFMVTLGAFQWITSGGDKEKVSQARSRITYAIIGVILLSIMFVILNVLGGITGFEFFHDSVTPPGGCGTPGHPVC